MGVEPFHGLRKCRAGTRSTERGIEMDRTNVDLIVTLPPPLKLKQVRSFLGHIKFYRKFIKDFSKIARLTNLLSKDVLFTIVGVCLSAFNTLKKALCTSLLMVTPDCSRSFELMCDASDYALGAVLGQRKNNLAQVIYYTSRTLADALVSYSTTKKGFLAVVFTLDKFRSYLLGAKVSVFTSYSALLYLIKKKE